MENVWKLFLTIAGLVVLIRVFYVIMTGAQPVKSVWLTGYRYAHRGLHNCESAENSISAFENAMDKGYAIELDVRLTLDGQIVVFHDEDLLRVTGVNKKIAECGAEELSNFRLENTAEGIPLLWQVLDLVHGAVPVLIEIKNTGRAGELEKKTLEMLEKYDGRIAVQSFSPYSVQWFRKHAPGLLRGQLSARFEDMREEMPGYQIFGIKNLLSNFLARPNFISYEVSGLPKGVVTRLRKKGVPVLGWTVQSDSQKETAMRYCDTIIFENIMP